jgi:hypothetical protein
LRNHIDQTMRGHSGVSGSAGQAVEAGRLQEFVGQTPI